METQQPSTPPVAPQPPVSKLSWREKYAGIIVLFIGIVYLLWQVTNYLSSKSAAYTLNDGSFNINTSELFNDIRSIVSILLALTGGWLLLKGKRAGWVIGVSLLFLFLLIAAGIMVSGYAVADTTSKIAGGAIAFLFLLALIFLLLPSARLKYKAGRNALVTTTALIVFLMVLYFFLQ